MSSSDKPPQVRSEVTSDQTTEGVATLAQTGTGPKKLTEEGKAQAKAAAKVELERVRAPWPEEP